MPIQRLVIVADAHLGAVPERVESALLRFLDAVPQLGDGLLLNGDLFGFWFSYRRAIPRTGIRVVSRLATLARNFPIMMTGGNHDRWGVGFWERELAIPFAPGELELKLGTGTVLALHGDGLAEPSWRAGFKNRLVRNPLVSAGYRILPADLGFWITSHMGGGNPTGASRRQEAKAAALQRSWAEQRLSNAPAGTLLIMGHTHVAAAETTSPGRRYLNPGAWLDGQRYAVATDTTLELRQYPG